MHNLFNTERYTDHVLSYDYSVVFDDGELVLFFDNMPFWKNHMKKGSVSAGLARWGRRVELYIRLRLKLRARYSRLSHKQHHHATPQDQPTSKARPAA